MISLLHGHHGTENPLTNTQRLRKAGFSKMHRVHLLCARLGLFDVAARVPRLLPKRGMVFVSRWTGGAREAFVELSVSTAQPELRRGAVVTRISFFTHFGQKIKTAPCVYDSFFADPLGHATPQRVYFTPPAEARWIMVRLTRQNKGHRIGIAGSLSPKTTSEPMLALDEALALRDERQLRLRLSVALKTCNRRDGLKILARLIYLKQLPGDMQALRVVDDLDHMIAQAGKSIAAISEQTTETSTTPFIYSKLYGPVYSGLYPLSKWLRMERSKLAAHRRSAPVIVPPGPHSFLRHLVAGIPEQEPVTETRSPTMPVGEIPWLNLRDWQTLVKACPDGI